MRLIIAGDGVVGGATRRWLQTNTHHEILVYDPPKELLCPFYDADMVFISVPVPTKGLKQDLTIVKEILHKCPNVPIFLRSTVLPGTCDRLSLQTGKMVCHFPEFLTARSADYDFVATVDHIIGFHPILDSSIRDGVLQSLQEAFPHKKFHGLENTEAEIIKYAHNCFAAMKVIFFNGISQLCTRHNANYENVKKWVPKVTKFISPKHMDVPGPDGKLGFGGMCFPKDMAALMGHVGSNPFYMLLEKVFTLNMFYRGERKFPGIESTEPTLPADGQSIVCDDREAPGNLKKI